MRAATKSRGESSSKNDVHGAALAIAVLNFVRPDLRSFVIPKSGHVDLTRKDGYDETVRRILEDYCLATDSIAVFSEARRLHDVLLSSDSLIRALAKQRTGARRRGAK
jgi:hypothetical protein